VEKGINVSSVVCVWRVCVGVWVSQLVELLLVMLVVNLHLVQYQTPYTWVQVNIVNGLDTSREPPVAQISF